MPMLLPLALAAAALLPLAQPKPLPAAFFTGREGGADHGTGWVEVVPPAATLPAPWPPSSPSWQVNGTTLTVTIASFRDPLCPQTLFNLFTKAAHPERVTVSVVQQNEPGDPDCLEGYCALAGGAACPHRGQVRVLNRPAREMHGPVHARSLGSRLVGDEEFCMQVRAAALLLLVLVLLSTHALRPSFFFHVTDRLAHGLYPRVGLGAVPGVGVREQ